MAVPAVDRIVVNPMLVDQAHHILAEATDVMVAVAVILAVAVVIPTAGMTTRVIHHAVPKKKLPFKLGVALVA